MQNNAEIQIRAATIADLNFIISLVPRLIEFGPPHWRNPDEMISTDRKILTDKLADQPEGTAIFIAEDSAQVPLGFIHVHTGSDYYNKDIHGHISDVIVAPAGKGKGIGTLLIKKAEDWARAQGYKWLTLSVFAQNQQAIEVYERLGYAPDIVKFVKVI